MSSETFAGLLSARRRRPLRNGGVEDRAEPVAPARPAGLAAPYLRQVMVTGAPLWLADQASLLLSLGLMCGINSLLSEPVWLDVLPLAIGLSIAMFVANYGLGLYPGVGIGTTTELRRSALASTLVLGVFCVATVLRDGLQTSVWLLGIAWGVSLALFPTFRWFARRQAAKTSWWGQPVLILGGGAAEAAAYRALLATPEQGLRPVGILWDELHHHWGDEHVDPDWYAGPLAEAEQIAGQKGVFWGLFVMGRHTDQDVAHVIDRYAAVFPHLLIQPNLGMPTRVWRGAHECGCTAGLRIDERLLLPVPRFVKRTSDLLLTIVGGVLLLPVVAVIAWMVKLSSPGPVFYSQERVGHRGRRFRAWKFRTMVANADEVLAGHFGLHPELKAEWDRDHKLKSDPRITRIGRWLRKTSLDELPQLWNVLLGEMSLVGPRPIVQAEICKYGAAFALYQRVVPGITGLWQVSGRNNTTYEKRVELDMYYGRNWSMWFDVQILFATIDVVLHCRGAY